MSRVSRAVGRTHSTNPQKAAVRLFAPRIVADSQRSVRLCCIADVHELLGQVPRRHRVLLPFNQILNSFVRVSLSLFVVHYKSFVVYMLRVLLGCFSSSVSHIIVVVPGGCLFIPISNGKKKAHFPGFSKNRISRQSICPSRCD